MEMGSSHPQQAAHRGRSLEGLGVADDLSPHEGRGVDQRHAPRTLVDALDEVTQAGSGDDLDRGADRRPALHVDDRRECVVDAARGLDAVDEMVRLLATVERVVEEVVGTDGQARGPGPSHVGREHGVEEVVVLGGLHEDEAVARVPHRAVVDIAVVVADVEPGDERGAERQLTGHEGGRDRLGLVGGIGGAGSEAAPASSAGSSTIGVGSGVAEGVGSAPGGQGGSLGSPGPLNLPPRGWQPMPLPSASKTVCASTSVGRRAASTTAGPTERGPGSSSMEIVNAWASATTRRSVMWLGEGTGAARFAQAAG